MRRIPLLLMMLSASALTAGQAPAADNNPPKQLRVGLLLVRVDARPDVRYPTPVPPPKPTPARADPAPSEPAPVGPKGSRRRPSAKGLVPSRPMLPSGPGVWSNRNALPKRLGSREVKYERFPLGTDNPEPEVYDVVVLLPELAVRFAAVDRHAKTFHRYVKKGGGLVVFQPNPLSKYPANAPQPPGLPDDCNANQYTRPKFLPYPVTFYNWYVKKEQVKILAKEHPIVAGFADAQMPYAYDRLFQVDPKYKPLTMGGKSESPTLAVAEFGKGRIVLCCDNVAGGTYSRPPKALVVRMLLWAAGASDAEVRAVKAPLLPDDEVGKKAKSKQ